MVFLLNIFCIFRLHSQLFMSTDFHRLGVLFTCLSFPLLYQKCKFNRFMKRRKSLSTLYPKPFQTRAWKLALKVPALYITEKKKKKNETTEQLRLTLPTKNGSNLALPSFSKVPTIFFFLSLLFTLSLFSIFKP